MTLRGIGGGNLKSMKTLRVERSWWYLAGRISTSPRYVIDIAGLDWLSLGELGEGGVNSEKLGIFNLRTGDQILMKFDF